jgi:hypothetical protein
MAIILLTLDVCIIKTRKHEISGFIDPTKPSPFEMIALRYLSASTKKKLLGQMCYCERNERKIGT